MTRAEAHRRALASVDRARANLALRERLASGLAVELWQAGKSINEVAAEIGISRDTVQRRLRAAGVRCDQAEKNRRIARRHGRRVSWTPDMVAAFVQARQSRVRYVDCARLIGVGLHSIKAKGRELGLDGRRA